VFLTGARDLTLGIYVRSRLRCVRSSLRRAREEADRWRLTNEVESCGHMSVDVCLVIMTGMSGRVEKTPNEGVTTIFALRAINRSVGRPLAVAEHP
jgi:hypothetical protein